MDALSTTSINALRSFLVAAALLLLAESSEAQNAAIELTGHSKTRMLADRYPAASFFNDLTGSTAASLESELRLNVDFDRGPWSLDAAWQLYGAWGDRVELLRDLGGTSLPGLSYLPSDERRLMQLTDPLRDDGKLVAAHRIDRLSVAYAKDKLVLRFGRQAISWGNGLIFSPMDIVNPFDPVAVDTEYKAGDDMVYSQYLRSNGDDIEFAHVFRRDPLSGDPRASVSTTAIKYHAILGDSEYDLLAARDNGRATVAVGGNKSIGGAVLRGDLVWADSSQGSELQLVANLSYSWVLGGRNMSGIVEFFFSGFGQRAGRYDLASLSQNVELLSRLQRGEAFTLGRNYLAGGLLIELSPLWQVTPNLFANLDDGSALLQIVSRRSLGDNSEFLAALNLPLGPDGTEFGGVAASIPGVYLSTDLSLFAQFAWYF
jgi:hypothetical protein